MPASKNILLCNLLCVSIAFFFPVTMLLSGCNNDDNEQGFHFTLMKPSHTNIDFNNTLTESDSVNFLINQYIYIGGGVAAGDFNNDGLQDLFFAGGQVSCKLYVNKGEFQFDDVTENAGVTTTAWCTGVSVVDINNDGLQDIYVCTSHKKQPEQRRNLLFINEGNLKFREDAKLYGLDDAGFSTQAAFFDYDKDGDLDMYLMNHTTYQDRPNDIVQDTKGSNTATDRLYRNEGITAGRNHPFFKEVSSEAGIKDVGYGLGLVVSDFNSDNWPDVYVANDFLSNDLLWLNNKHGGFNNCIARSTGHQSYNSMGVDAADINNDALPDIGVLDMQPATNFRKKVMFAGSNPERYDMAITVGGYQPQFTRNMLQLNNGIRFKDSVAEPFFSEIGQLAGMSETDWSWSISMCDFDNDGWKDIYITNGLARDLSNNDFLFFRHGENIGGLAAQDAPAHNDTNTLRKQMESYGDVRLNNFLFRNTGELFFEDVSAAAGINKPSISHGAATVDLDNDGDLDMVVNNMNQEAFVWRNDIRKTQKDTINNYLKIKLTGAENNKNASGCKVTVYCGHQLQYAEQQVVRGYLSSIDNRLNFGLGNKNVVDSIYIRWPDDRVQVLKNIPANQELSLNHDGARYEVQMPLPVAHTIFEANNIANGYKHQEINFFDYARQRLLPQKYSQLGPALDTADVNGDGLTDFFIGGGVYQWGQIFMQNRDGGFTSFNLSQGEKTSEDISAHFFDVDNDHDNDLLVAEGSLEFGNSITNNLLKLYINDGKGRFELKKDAFPKDLMVIGQALAVGDFDNDNDMDIFVGGRMLPDKYPLSPRSYLLQNNNGIFADVTKRTAPTLEFAGMITDALWLDFNKDDRLDLVLCGEWMPIRFFKNTGNGLTEYTSETKLENTSGWWRSLHAADLDGDGDTDILAGNMGENNRYHATPQMPVKLYAKDIDGNGSLDLLPAYFIKNDAGTRELFPAIDRTQLAEEVIAVKKKYLLNKDYAGVNMQELANTLSLKDAAAFSCELTASVWLENLGNGHYELHMLPVEAQFAPVNCFAVSDFDADGIADVLLAGNESQAEVVSGRYDASYGLLLKGQGRGNFTTIKFAESGLAINGDVKQLRTLFTGSRKQCLLAAINNDSLKCFTIKAHK